MKALLCLRALYKGADSLAFGRIIANLKATDLVILTVIGSHEDPRPVEDQLAAAMAYISEQGVANKLSSKIRHGPTVPQITQELKENNYDLVIVGTQVAQHLWTALFGTITRRITDSANVPVLVVRSVPESIQRILVFVGGSRPRRKPIRFSCRLAKLTNAAVKLLYVADPVPSMYTGLGAMDESLADLLQTETPIAQHLRWSADYLARRDVSAEIKWRHGAVDDEILREVLEGRYDLIVIGAGPRNPLQRVLADSVHQRLIDEAPCSVLIVR